VCVHLARRPADFPLLWGGTLGLEWSSAQQSRSALKRPPGSTSSAPTPPRAHAHCGRRPWRVGRWPGRLRTGAPGARRRPSVSHPRGRGPQSGTPKGETSPQLLKLRTDHHVWRPVDQMIGDLQSRSIEHRQHGWAPPVLLTELTDVLFEHCRAACRRRSTCRILETLDRPGVRGPAGKREILISQAQVDTQRISRIGFHAGVRQGLLLSRPCPPRARCARCRPPIPGTSPSRR